MWGSLLWGGARLGSRLVAARGRFSAVAPGRPAGKKATKPKKGAKRKVAQKYKDPQSGATWSGRGLTPNHRLGSEKASDRFRFADVAPSLTPRRGGRGRG